MVSETVDCTSSFLENGAESVDCTRLSFDRSTVTVDCTKFILDKGTWTVDCTRSAPNFMWRLLSYHGDGLTDFVSRCYFDPAHVQNLGTGDYSYSLQVAIHSILSNIWLLDLCSGLR